MAATVTPIIHPTAPFLIDVPGLERQVAPAVRMMTWMDSGERFLTYPLLGLGIGADAANVRYIDPSGVTHRLTDAHNVFLNFAAQCGLIGLAAMVMLILHVTKIAWPRRFRQTNVIRLGLAIAWLNAFVYQGPTGSYEDARHLWLLLGILVATSATQQAIGERIRATPPAPSL